MVTRTIFRNNPGWKRVCLLLSCVCFLVAGILFTFPHIRPARAAGATLVVSPTSGSYSGRFVTVTGASYAANETVKVYWNYSGPDTGSLKVTVSADNTGAFSTNFAIPLAASGVYTIAGVGQTSNLVATGTFQLLPSLQVNPLVGIIGTPFTVIGEAYGAGESVKIYWNYHGAGTGALLTTATGDSTGSFSVNVAVPAGAKPVIIPVTGIGQTTNTSASAIFTIYPPTLALAPLQGSAGTSLTLSAYGFQPSETVSVYWNNSATAILTSPTDFNGYFTPTVITVPADSAPGSYPVKMVGQTSNITATNTFTVVAPVASWSLSTGPVGEQVNISGQGYQPGETVNVLWNYTGPGTGSSVASATAGYAGTVTASFAVPTAANGVYTVAVVGQTSNSVTQSNFTVQNSIAVFPSIAPPGSSVTVAGTGFQAGELVAIHWSTLTGPLLATTTADANGNIKVAVATLASAWYGSHNIVAVGKSSGQTLTTAVMVNTNWGDFGFDNLHHRQNIDENLVSTSNASALKLKWKTTTALNLYSSPVYANGIVYLSTSMGQLNAYNATTGSPIWAFKSNTGFSSQSAPLVDSTNNIVFFGEVGQEDPGIPSPTYALDAQTGALKWSLIIPSDEFGFPTLAFNTIYVGNSHENGPGALLAIDVMSGHVNWQHATNGGVWGSAATDVSTQTVITGVGNPANQVLALNAITGAFVWQFNVPNSKGNHDVGSGIAISNGMVYADSKNGFVYALHESDGTLAWSTATSPFNSGNVSSPAVANGILYVGSLDKNLYALNANTGAILWKVLTGNGMNASPAVANGVVYIASLDHDIYAVNAATGAVLWKYTMNGRSTSSPIIANGWLYCGSVSGNLYAFHT